MRITFNDADIFNDKLTNAEMRQLITVYKKSLKELEQLIIKIKKEYAETWFMMSQYKRYRAIAKQINDIIKQLTNKTNVIIVKGEKDSYKSSYKITEKKFKAKIGISFTVIDTKSVAKAIKNPMTKITTIERNTTNLKQLKSDLTQNLVLGNSYKKTAKKISERYDVALHKADRIVRTENHRVQLDARLDGFKDAEKQGIELKKEWISALDKRTRSSHRALNGTIIPVNDNFHSSTGGNGKAPGQMGGPDDINCRCSLAAVVL